MRNIRMRTKFCNRIGSNEKTVRLGKLILRINQALKTVNMEMAGLKQQSEKAAVFL